MSFLNILSFWLHCSSFVVLESVSFLQSHHQKFLFCDNRLTDQRRQANDSVLTACYFSFTYHLKPVHVVVHIQVKYLLVEHLFQGR